MLKMEYVLKPTLEHMALVKIAVTLWNQDDIMALIAKFRFPVLSIKYIEQWQSVESKVAEKMLKLPQPERFKEKILAFIKPVGLQISKWIEYHRNYLKEDLLPIALCWSPEGTVNKLETAKKLIKNESINVTTRYKLACVYCLESDILELWNKMPEVSQKLFYSEKDPIYVKQQELVVTWTYFIKGEVAKMDNRIERRTYRRSSLFRYAFNYGSESGNKTALEYFLQKLPPSEREESLLRTAKSIARRRSEGTRFHVLPYADMLCFLLSQMNEKQQTIVLKICPYEVLRCFLDWPWQIKFMEMANHVNKIISAKGYNRRNYILPEKCCDCILRSIINKRTRGFTDCSYQAIFSEIWRQCSNAHKRYIIERCGVADLLYKLLQIKDEENIKLIFQDLTLTEKQKLISSDMGKYICRDLIHFEDWDLVNFFIRECLSKSEVMLFKKEFKERITWLCSKDEKDELETNKEKWDKFYQVLDDFAYGSTKRKCTEEDEAGPSKKFCDKS